MNWVQSATKAAVVNKPYGVVGEHAVGRPAIRSDGGCIRRYRWGSFRRCDSAGNVLSHYLRDIVPGRSHIVVAKYEIAEGVVNEDIVSYEVEPLDLIISISTLDHDGWDAQPRDPEKVLRAIDDLKKLLKPGGELVLSMPLAYHPRLDWARTNGESSV